MRLLRTFLPLAAAALLLVTLPEAEAEAVATLKIATVAPEGTPWADGLNQLKAQVEKDSGGRVAVRTFLGGVLGDENETVQSVQRGQYQGVGASTGALASIVPELSVLELPYLFRSAEEADYVLDKVILTAVEKAFKDHGLILAFWSENGYRTFGSNWGPVKSPADLKGRKMRSQESEVHLQMYRSFGASPVPIPVTEVLTSMQTGVIDGWDNTPLFAFAAQWTSATKFVSLTNHIYQPAAIAYNKAWFESQPADLQAILLKARTGLAPQMRKEIRALNPILIQNLSEMKVTVYKPTATELAAFEAPAKVARDTYMAKATAGEKALLAQIVKGIDAYRAGAR
ncbi:MAG: TRAP transporter substrate-binding protein DctP [Pseudomonadota bacterium]|nr:TRAP transporter substrate-binding protein DctP [Pseudomonadota bacterium]